ncbi:uncharacterized protein LOC131300873 isoform X2 [Rhododendron vialii]|uniref:uncharacterized protein LOC131300873 isoform X2 n=1 Tax=Rhododendron vialii TaxID=182163 RepID=UPI00265F06B8|nr:uncharacterized protein LOC131300873 isoform X2 [Rhododendron vialii]XP_058182871.1 uncharacterized protein LOC131300873 isoform X2 [Rhododendron vialii]XP_058182872.1 uncharacterized protein LOC131300873 isoform X2 [Rhododendron vialii]XP_058182873.1 uncharacterized protein LOC131300873 isoform X2 [Rhododendron vialii]
MDKLQWGKRKRLRCVKGEEKGGERMDKLQWGKRKRLRCVKVVKDSSVLGEKSAAAGVGDGAVRKEITSLVVGSVAADANRQIYPPLLQSPPCLGRDLGEDEQIKFERQHESGNNSVVTGERRSILSNSGGQ